MVTIAVLNRGLIFKITGTITNQASNVFAIRIVLGKINDGAFGNFCTR